MRVLAMAACLALVSGAALAQQSSSADAEMLCIYDALPDNEAIMLVGAMLTGEKGNEARIQAAMKTAHDACGKKHGWSAPLHVIAEDIAIGGLLHEASLAGLEDLGFKDFDRIEKLVEDLPDADYALILDGDYEKDATLKPRLNALLKAAGVPEKEQGMDIGLAVIETMALTDDAIADWYDEKKAPAAASPPSNR